MAAWPIEWHENTLKNYRENYACKQEEVDRLVGELVRWEADITRWQMQIDAAKKQGKKAFDRDKFLRVRSPAAQEQGEKK